VEGLILGGERAVGAECTVGAELDLPSEETGEGVVDEILAAFAVELVELVACVPLLIEDTHKGGQARVVKLHADTAAEAALLALAGNAEKVAHVQGAVIHFGIGTELDALQHLFEGIGKKYKGHSAFRSGIRAEAYGRRDVGLGQPVFNDMVAVVPEIADESVVHRSMRVERGEVEGRLRRGCWWVICAGWMCGGERIGCGKSSLPEQGLIIPEGALNCLGRSRLKLRIFCIRFNFSAMLTETGHPRKLPRKRAEPPARQGKSVAEKLASSELFKDYERAFREATGLPLAIRPAKAYQSALRNKSSENPFCALMANTNQGCANCLKMQEKLEQEAGLEPKSLHCFAGLCDSAVPIRVGDELIAFLQTGQILLHQPNQEEFTRTTKQLLSWGADINLKALEEAYFQTKVFDETQYKAMLRLLSTFAEHLATISNSIEPETTKEAMAESGAYEAPLVGNAKRYIQDRYQEKISLDEAAQAVNASTRHFCKVFKEATGYTFTDYLARIRVEKAKNLLQNPHLRVSEIAFETGFESISQFNRSFKRITNLAPTQYRAEFC